MQRIQRFTKLTNQVEELLGELEDTYNPEVQELRGRVEDALAAAKRAIGQQNNAIGRQGKKASARIAQYAGFVNDYINDYPRLAFIAGALIFGTIGYLAGISTRERE